MNLNDIRNLNDKDLNKFLNSISNNKGRVCCKCGKIIFKNERITLMKNIDISTKKLCCICSNCYINLLDYLGLSDVE